MKMVLVDGKQNPKSGAARVGLARIRTHAAMRPQLKARAVQAEAVEAKAPEDGRKDRPLEPVMVTAADLARAHPAVVVAAPEEARAPVGGPIPRPQHQRLAVTAVGPARVHPAVEAAADRAAVGDRKVLLRERVEVTVLGREVQEAAVADQVATAIVERRYAERTRTGRPFRVDPRHSPPLKGNTDMLRGGLLWLIGLPIPIILLLWLFGALS